MQSLESEIVSLASNNFGEVLEIICVGPLSHLFLQKSLYLYKLNVMYYVVWYSLY